MNNAKDYFEIDESKNHFSMPLSFFGHLKYFFYKSFFTHFELSQNTFIESGLYGRYYWSVILGYLKKEFDITFSLRPRTIRGKHFGYSTSISAIEVISENLESKIGTGGSDLEDKEISLSKAIGECLERKFTFSPSEIDKKRIKLLNWGQYKLEIKTTRDFHFFSKEQLEKYPKLNIDSIDKIKMIEVDCIDTLKKVSNKKYYPLQEIFWSGGHSINQGHFFVGLTTSGCGGGFTEEEASLAALFEAIERDSFFCHWLTKSSPKKIKFKVGENQLYDSVVKSLGYLGLDLHLLDISTNMEVPTVLALVKDRHRKCFYICASSNFDGNIAINKSINEMLSILNSLDFFKSATLPVNYRAFFDNKVDRTFRLNLAANPEYLSWSDFLLEGNEIVYGDFLIKNLKNIDGQPKKSFIELLEFLQKRDADTCYSYRFTAKAEQLDKLGYFVSRVVVPKLYPLYLLENFALTKSKRLDEFYKWKTGRSEFKINTNPHPFP